MKPHRFSSSICACLAISIALCAGLSIPIRAQSIVAPYPASFSLGTLNGQQGFRMNGSTGLGKAGHSVTGIGDLNGDDFDDIAVCAAEFLVEDISVDPPALRPEGRCYVIFGTDPASSIVSTLNLESLAPNQGFTILGSNNERAGFSVNRLGDVNDDGNTDMIIGAPYADNGAGAAYVVFGRGTGNLFPAQLKLSDLNGSDGFKISGAPPGAALGHAVSSSGDMNGDGIADILVGAPLNGDPQTWLYRGSVYVIFGHNTNPPNVTFPAVIDVVALDGTASSGFRIDGEAAGDNFGFSVAPAGNINNDSNLGGLAPYEDIIVGATGADINANSSSGAGYVLFGHSPPFGINGVIDLSDPNILHSPTGFRIPGESSNHFLGASVSGGGDVNGDGISDLLISAPFADWDPSQHPNSGSVYVVFGPTLVGDTLELYSLNGETGFRIDGDAEDYIGMSVQTLKDTNGDGKDEILIGAPFASFALGRAYVVFGRKASVAQEGKVTFNLTYLQNLGGLRGFRLEGINNGDQTGFRVSSAGDFNADGSNDMIIGAPYAQPGNMDKAGSGFLVNMSRDRLFGSAFEKDE